MSKVAPITTRKDDHLKINLQENVQSALTTGLERYQFIHEALPELDLAKVDTSLTLFGKALRAPILISSMTGGTAEAATINLHLAEAAQEMGVAMGLGSQRAALERPELSETFQVRRIAPDILLFANLGAVQLNYGFGIDECRRAVEMVDADALVLHLNPLQEALQQEGNTNFEGLAKKIELIATRLNVPIIAKEVGWGISQRTAKLLQNSGVSAIDIAGAGGTSWSQVEMHRAPDEFSRELAAAYISWGITTSQAIINVKSATPTIPIFASGGIRDGLEIAKCISLGATLGGMAGKFLKTAATSTRQTTEVIKLIQAQIKITMFATGSRTLSDLVPDKLNEQ